MASSSCITATELEKKSTTVPNWLELPRDVTANILRRLNTVDRITRACQVCPLWWNICKDPSMWRTIRMVNICGNRVYSEKICFSAITRSCGQLEDIDIKYFATDDLFQYIADCAKNLRRIRLVECGERLTFKGFGEAVKKLPLIEELQISHCGLSKDSLEVVGRYCPLLKSLKYGKFIDDEYYIESMAEEETGFIIAETMSGLHHLIISGNVLTTEGVLAILDGCPLLETFDLQGCRELYLSDTLMKRCHDLIKDFRPPKYMYCSSVDDSY